MGSVYRAHDRELDEIVALKMLRGDLGDVGGDAGALPPRGEARAPRVTHRNVARTFDIGEHAGEKFLTMEYVDGELLAARLEHRGALGIGEAVAIASEICAGLSAAHAAGIIHRDLKPDNVLLAKDGRVVLTDFGIARLVAPDASAFATAGSVIGTPTYMAPEQVEGGAIDARADVYAVGEILFEMLAGTPPWTGGSVIQVAAARPSRTARSRRGSPRLAVGALVRGEPSNGAMARRSVPHDRGPGERAREPHLAARRSEHRAASADARAIVAPSDDATSVGERRWLSSCGRASAHRTTPTSPKGSPKI
ncbi:MAG: serine/threonine-protein kinase [Polyangiaceae bacterium]